MNERLNNLPHESIIECYFEPEKNRSELELVFSKL